MTKKASFDASSGESFGDDLHRTAPRCTAAAAQATAPGVVPHVWSGLRERVASSAGPAGR
jgi:hypothetical protein